MSGETVTAMTLGIALGVPLLVLVVQQRNAGRSAFLSETTARIEGLRTERDEWRQRALDCEARERTED